MNISELLIAIILGLVQGLTEFIPVSSSGHLLFVTEYLTGGKQISLGAVAFINFGTTVAIIQYFRKDIVELFNFKKKSNLIKIGLMVLATFPTFLAVLLFSDYLDSIRSPLIFAWAMIFGGLLLWVSELYNSRNHSTKRGEKWHDYFILGIWQSAALIPGMSRSGSTLTGALFCNLDRAKAVRLSFFISLPIFVLGFVYGLMDLSQSVSSQVIYEFSWFSIILATIIAYISGYLVIKWLIKFLIKQSSIWFIIYRIILGITILLFLV